MKEYNKDAIKETFFTIEILDDCFKIHGEVYDEISGVHCPQTLIGCARKVVEMLKADKERRQWDKGEIVWDYRIIKHEIDDEFDWQSEYKVYKYKGQYKVKRSD